MERSYEIRIALVLYGGVSLAVYENGVTRCFHDLIRGRGVFGPLLSLLDAKATVDVIAGTSAGGINGLILAACLESGREFAPTADIWRRLGDLGSLLRDVRASADAESLLDGEGYYQRALVDAFRGLCAPVGNGYESPGEIDVFITGTDVEGHKRSYVDGLGADVSDKEHRTVFHLQHRPGRKWLGMGATTEPVDTQQQGVVLGAIARITSSFPVAFPPFRRADIARAYGDQAAEALAQALSRSSQVDEAGDAIYVDGGVLDNKPFGPALRAIFHRMPNGPVDRRLFYVEPDPVRYSKNDGRHAPVDIGIASLTSLPSYESIGGDLDALTTHNARVKWLLGLKNGMRQADLSAAAAASPIYVSTRIDATARALVLDADVAPTAGDVPSDGRRARLVEELAATLRQRVGTELIYLDPWDVNFHLRRAFHVLYDLHDRVSGEREAPLDSAARCAMQLVGRLIKALKLVRDFVAELRDELFAAPDQTWNADDLFETFIRFLDEDAPPWKEIRQSLADRAVAGLLADPVARAACARDPRSFLPSAVLTTTADAARSITAKARGGTLGQDALPPLDTHKPTILMRLSGALADIVEATDGNRARFDQFSALDAMLYPLEFASGVYELDEVEFVRISPGDAQIGLSNGNAHEKVAGDTMAHFSAFLRRDWRTNDIIYGRLDGICQIVRGLLTDDAIARAVGRSSQLEALSADGLAKAMPECPPGPRAAVEDAWAEAKAACPRRAGTAAERAAFEQACNRLRATLILAGQEQVVGEDLGRLYADQMFQEIAYGFARGRSASLATSADMIEREAAEAAHAQMQALEACERSARFCELKLGSRPISGVDGRLPNTRIAEYGTQAYLHLWGMIRQSLGKNAGVLTAPHSRLFLRSPMRVLHLFSVLVRRERTLAVAAAAAAVGLEIGGLALLLFYIGNLSEHWRVLAMLLAALCITGFGIRLLEGVSARPLSWQPAAPRRRWRKAVGIALAVVAAALVAAWWWREPNWPYWGAVAVASSWVGLAAVAASFWLQRRQLPPAVDRIAAGALIPRAELERLSSGFADQR